MQGEYKKGTIERNYKNTTYAGGDSWQTFFSGYGILQNGQGREYFAAKQRHSELSAIWRLTQYVHRVDETMRVKIDTIIYEIISIDGIREQNWTELRLKKVL